jgi:cation diffusion facilitator CzcD-associated flavoprotein CzcO
MTEAAVKRVAVIGTGISGVCAAAHALKQGLEVVAFERSGIAGGVWHFDKRTALDPTPYPNETPSKGDYEPSPEFAYSTPPPDDEDDDELEITHAPPGPCYAGLRNNVSTTEMRTSLEPWPAGTEDFVGQSIIEEYVQRLAERHGVDAVTEYNTRVEEVRKQEEYWVVRTTTLNSTSGRRLVERRWTFDAVVVASGHYSMPRIPDFPGLSEWKRMYPDRVWHSKRYRTPLVFKDQNVLLVGAGVSAWDIAKESAPMARHIYQSSRDGPFDLPASFLPEGATRVGAIKAFELDASRFNASKDDSKAITGRVVFESGETLADIDSVVLCTGYVTSYPFLSHLHRDNIPMHQADHTALVTSEGNMNHNLHKDIFYIEDPSLIFIGVPYHIATFSLFDFQAQAAARVLSGKAQLPSYEQMRREYDTKVQTKGLGRMFHSLKGPAEEAYVRDLVDWVNADAERLGVQDKMVGHTADWLVAKKIRDERIRMIFGAKDKERESTAIVKAVVG